jgi:hypothetical protein
VAGVGNDDFVLSSRGTEHTICALRDSVFPAVPHSRSSWFGIFCHDSPVRSFHTLFFVSSYRTLAVMTRLE